jgi:hypothetical protein
MRSRYPRPGTEAGQFDEFQASELYCNRCRGARPVRERLLLVLPEGEQGLAPVALADVLAKPEDGKKVRLEGTVEAVCKNKGCWMALRQGDRSVHVTFEGYSFFLPKDAATKKAALEGKVVVKPVDAAHVAHLKGEGAGDGAAAKVSVEAYGVELR